MEDFGNAEKEHLWGKGNVSHQISFKDKLVGETPGAYRQAFNLMDQMEAPPESEPDTSSLRKRLAAMRLSDDLKQKIKALWSRARIMRTVIYEGIQKLCFSYGWIGHRKEVCPHTIRSVHPPSKEEAGEVVKAQECPCERHVAELAGDHQSGDSTNEDNLYGPWMVVTRKRSWYKSSRDNNFPGTSCYLEKGQGPPDTTLNRNDISKERGHGSKRKNIMAQTVVGHQ
ncbi:hypothetical protein SO802_029825 [Lithocarpus litseifolius]|uniref:Zinc knuckle CX2CX4HX4C domain-containing protein n=1 Tax=Lithocarpus litseifolius TaxID=425828 RepID=A0AAW2BUR2_9ROSI